MAHPSPSKVAEQTARQIRRSLRRAPELGLTYYAAHPAELQQRLAELNQEWDLERIFESDSSSGSLVGLILGYAWSSRWFLLPFALQEFVLQHALLGHLPTLPLLGRLSYRTRREINHERWALETLQNPLLRGPRIAPQVEEFYVRPWAVRPLQSVVVASA